MYHKVTQMPYKIIRHWLAGPFILGMIIPITFFDICMEIYHRITFPLYGIPTVKRSSYIRLNRVKLSYLNPMDKMWCAYCQYTNGLMAYGVKIGSETEKYWCAIKNKGDDGYIPQPHQKEFLEYGDEEAYDNFVNSK
jgi:hypothetical protein